jgi:hypothetical protein
MSSFQPLWSNFGTSWAVGRYPGGRFRLAGSNTPNDTALANAIRAASSVCEPVP